MTSESGIDPLSLGYNKVLPDRTHIMKNNDLKEQAIQDIDTHRSELIDLSLKIHMNPEIGLEEVKASGWLTKYLENNGFQVERGIADLPTAFKASHGRGSPAIAFLAEYDALPKLGHACGHNIIATAAVGAGIAAKQAADRLGGTILVIGTPAEESHGGKLILADRGAFDQVDIALMVHPGCRDVADPEALAMLSLDVEFWGRAAHAAASPEDGINALEALILAFSSINSLRQHIRQTSRIHGIITCGGEAANIVPDHTQASFLVRTDDLKYLEELKEKIMNCFIAASLATGARLEHVWGKLFYAPLRPNFTLARLFAKNMGSLGREVHLGEPRPRLFSTDMGNISQRVPSIHPTVAITSSSIPWHTPEFAAAAASEAGHRGLLDSAKALALTAIDLLSTPEILDEIRTEFRNIA